MLNITLYQAYYVQIVIIMCTSYLQFVKDFKSLRRAFRKFDRHGTGELTATDFRTVLSSCNVNVTQEDLYHIMSLFDTALTGTVSYEQFIDQIMNTA